MTKKELVEFLGLYSDEIIITNQSGVNLKPIYQIDREGEGFVILTTNETYVKGKPLEWPIRFKDN